MSMETILINNYDKFCTFPIKKFVEVPSPHSKMWIYNYVKPLQHANLSVIPSDIVLPIGKFYKIQNEAIFIGYGIEFPNYAIINVYDHYISANKIEPKKTYSSIKMVFNSHLLIFVTDSTTENQAVLICDYDGRLMLTE